MNLHVPGVNEGIFKPARLGWRQPLFAYYVTSVWFKNLFTIFDWLDNREIRKVYPSDISREQFEHLRPLLESVRKQTKPRSVDLYKVFLASCFC
ncbi:hypothetical protein METHB2_650001 [Candidatus Methylobacter favarea]|uniref:Uncharacterized protein n=1 Tax=Candidatus Methylobacter favarea TaxID=2707345 RepID=A0A8S0XI49_9GAMM|nr:hypothetical protein METHB2_650001 [Candidatus Methylobacter favarea]